MSGGSPRHGRLASTLHREVQRVLSDGLSDPRLDGVLVTVIGVSVDEPGTTAVVRVALRPDRKMGLAALNQASSFVGRRAGERIAIRRMPRLIFKEDRGLRKEVEVLEALALARAEADTEAEELGDAGGVEANDAGGEAGGPPAPGREAEEKGR